MFKYLRLLLLMTVLLLSGCITFGDENGADIDENGTEDIAENDQKENNELENDSNDNENVDELEENNEANEEENNEEEIVELEGLDLRVVEVDQVLFDLEEIEGFDPEKHIVVEYENVLYFSNELVSDFIGIDVSYDADHLFSEIFEGESTYVHEMVYPDRMSSELPVNEFWRFDYDDYYTPESREYVYDYLEYDGQLFIPERVIEMIGDTPIYRDRQANVIEFGESSQEIELVTLEFNDRSHTTATPRDSITYEGENLGPGFDLDIGYFNVISSNGEFYVLTNGKKKTAYVTLTIYEITESSKMTDITITTGHEGKEEFQVIEVEEGDQLELEVDIAGSNYLMIETPTQVLMYVTGYIK